MCAQNPPLKVVATLGPATESGAVLGRWAEVATSFRLNTAHLELDQVLGWLKRIETLPGGPRPVVLDLQGRKMRLGVLEPLSGLGATVELVCAESTKAGGALPVPHPELFATLKPGERLWIDDGRVILEVLRADHEGARAKVLKDGPVLRRKGINREAASQVPWTLGSRDRGVIEAALDFNFTHFALSFVVDGKEARALRKLTDRSLVAKVEHPDAFAHLGAIAEAFDEVWLCRGDLGSHGSLAALPDLQRRFVRELHCKQGTRTYLAGQVLEHMTHHREPTRSEIVHLGDAAWSGFAGIVLSDETAIGQYPLELAALLESLPFVAAPCGLRGPLS